METKKLNIMVAVLFLLGTFFSAQSLALAAEKGMSSQKAGKEMTSTQKAASMTNPIRVSKLMDRTVRNQQNEKLGEVKDVVFDPNGRNAYLIVEHGGTLGMGEKYTAVPWKYTEFQKKDGHLAVVLNVSKEKFAKAPAFSEDHWPNFASKSWEEQVHSYYGGGNWGSSGTQGTMQKPEQKY